MKIYLLKTASNYEENIGVFSELEFAKDQAFNFSNKTSNDAFIIDELELDDPDHKHISWANYKNHWLLIDDNYIDNLNKIPEYIKERIKNAEIHVKSYKELIARNDVPQNQINRYKEFLKETEDFIKKNGGE